MTKPTTPTEQASELLSRADALLKENTALLKKTAAQRDALLKEWRKLAWENDSFRAALRTLYDKVRHISDDPQWAIEAADLDAARDALEGEK